MLRAVTLSPCTSVELITLSLQLVITHMTVKVLIQQRNGGQHLLHLNTGVPLHSQSIVRLLLFLFFLYNQGH